MAAEIGFSCVLTIITKVEMRVGGAYLLIREGRLFDIMGNYLEGLALFIAWELICQAFSRAWSMSLNSQ